MNKYEDKNGNIVDEHYEFTVETANKLKDKENVKDLLTLNTENKNVLKKYIMYRENSKILDPDNHSDLLQKIYEDKWDKTYLKTCKKKVNRKEGNMVVYSDTMTSAQTLLNKFYETVCENEWEKYKDKHKVNGKKIKYCGQKVITTILNEIEKETSYPMFEKYFLDDNSVVMQFLKHYHTIGNYIPVPKEFNTSRSGNYGSHDKWNLTLEKIYEYYQIEERSPIICKDNKVLMELLFSPYDKLSYAKKWLDSFGSWKNFIRENYLQDYINEEDENWPIKEEFTNKTNWKKLFPNEEEFLDYFALLTETIIARGNKILSGKKIEIK